MCDAPIRERGDQDKNKQRVAETGSPALGMGTVKDESLYKHGKMVSVRRQKGPCLLLHWKGSWFMTFSLLLGFECSPGPVSSKQTGFSILSRCGCLCREGRRLSWPSWPLKCHSSESPHPVREVKLGRGQGESQEGLCLPSQPPPREKSHRKSFKYSECT